jgi:hypothetical protein
MRPAASGEALHASRARRRAVWLAHYHTGLNGRLIAVMEYLGIAGGITKVTTEGEQELPPGAEY